MLPKPQKNWTPAHWASWKPFGIGEEYPNNYWEVLRAIWVNRDNLPYSWDVLNQGVCDGCALGTTGMKDWTSEGIHVCNVRLRLLRMNTMPAFSPHLLTSITELKRKNSAELREMGRLPSPMMRKRGEKGFRRISWDEAMEIICDRIPISQPDRLGVYLTSRGTVNETYYVTQKAVRAIGTNNIDNAARICHSPSTAGLKSALGIAATTCSYKDWIGTDLLVFIGSNVANNQPVTVKYLHWAKKAGTKIVVINTYREPGMERYWVPSIPESALFGTKFAEDFFLVNLGGDMAFLNGTLKQMIEHNWIDQSFIDNYTANFSEVKASLDNQSWEELERISGASREDMYAFAKMVGEAQKAVFVWSMGITQHECGEDNVRSIINLALSKGFVGREGCGLMPIRGHSGVQGGAEMGCYATVFPGGKPITEENAVKLSQQWGFNVPISLGLTAAEMIDAAHNRQLDVLFSVGGNFLEVLPQPDYIKEALQRVPLRVHIDIICSSQMLVDPADTVILLPATTRYEIPGGVTETSTERRVIFSPEITGHRITEARPEWQVFLEIARRAKPELADKLNFDSTAAIREEIAKVIPMYAGIQHLKETGDQFQYGGSHLCFGWNFPTPDGKAHFSVLSPSAKEIPEGYFLVTTRRGKQFNSMVQEKKDAITGAKRDAVLISQADATKLELEEGDRVVLKNDFGELKGRVYIAPVKPGNLQIHWPEGNVLLDKNKRSPEVEIPDYNALVRLEKEQRLY
ncbi:MAG TPA: formate dehydrogenase [Cyanobacteria bacterium UBA11149]|nr:formate dehydrogenase [Cyanobacteria bacterium UBA11367]HBE60199.1 formate dehydrogenase [Cyanobacteria bacterium UBA11366]HBK64500.1 formate dehydrogenase [Cyanobacteria bacterium UBA11166]HBR76458.1 formate dehydrogenase [Cyanobacteria bacterium UBA11159]HBS71978.1 formate dehydrogenase [Cyanobacteria bacterium UBA11153]HBW91503.1 formate dehydrogenase [Cyanobacteria bacterium UBA11149]HCA95609.1 formate dehydrogenase [Cyanobacteria bacterium UBA9226]